MQHAVLPANKPHLPLLPATEQHRPLVGTQRYRPTEGWRLSRLGWLVTYRSKVLPRKSNGR